MGQPSQPQDSPETAFANHRKGSLNGPANPSECAPGVIESDGQFLLGNAAETCRIGASRMAVHAHQAARDNGFSFSAVGGMIGKDASAPSRSFDPEDPHTVFRCLAALLILDKTHTWLRGAARLVGCELIEKPRLTPEQKLGRLLETLGRHGKMGAALVAEALGDEP